MSKKPQCGPEKTRPPNQKAGTSHLAHKMKRNYTEYVMSVIVDQALPDVRDGLKPIHRRILYAMYEDNLTTNKPLKKPATCVSDVLDRYHPHDDASVYDALVRLAQDFSMRYPLVDGHRNFGSISGDPPAAYRYTEACVAKISDKMLWEIERDMVGWDPDFDESRKRPQVLPPRFPNLLVNSFSDIAVGMATDIPPHNLREVINTMIYVLGNPETGLSNLMEHVKDPGFPTRGVVMGRSGTQAAYTTSWGRMCIRAYTESEEFGNNRTRAIVTGTLYQVNKCMPIRNMAGQMEDKRLEGISDIRDESNRSSIRAVIELKRDANLQMVLSRLLAQAQLQTTFVINILALVRSGSQPQPRILSLRHILDKYIAFQEEVIVCRTHYDLCRVQERAHLLESPLIVEGNTDVVIQIIRENYDDAKENLMSRFGLSDVQAQAILDMQLRRLQGLKKEKLQNKHKKLGTRIAYFNEPPSSEERIRGVLKDELATIWDRYGDDRVTEIQDVEGEIDIEDLIKEEECVFTFTAGGYIKRTATSTYKARRRDDGGITATSTKKKDYADTVLATSTHDFILFLTSKGRTYHRKDYQIPKTGRTVRGTNLVNVLLIKQDEKVTATIRLRGFPKDRCLVMITRSGTVKHIQLSPIYTAHKAGIRCITLNKGDELICVQETNGDQATLIVTHDGTTICFKEIDIHYMGQDAADVRGINLRPGDCVMGAARAKWDHRVLMTTENGYGKRIDMDEYTRVDGPQRRGRLGLKDYNVTEKIGPVVEVKAVSDEDDMLVINDAGMIIRMAAAGISTYGCTAQGVKIMNLEEEVKMVSFARTNRGEEEGAAKEETPIGGLEQA